VTRSIADVITRVKKAGRKIGICGQAPSDYPEFAEFLVQCGIDSLSLTADTVLATTLRVLEMEQRMES
jgi:pyruvate,water dikinase